MCRFVKLVIVHRRPRVLEADGVRRVCPYRGSICTTDSIDVACVHGRDFARNGEKRILGVAFKENPIGMNSNGVRASSFFSFLFSLLVSSSFTRRNVSFTRIVIRRPGRNDSANGTTLAVVSSRRATRRHDEGEKREREREWGKEKNNYTVRESVSMKVCSPSVYRESVLSATRSR